MGITADNARLRALAVQLLVSVAYGNDKDAQQLVNAICGMLGDPTHGTVPTLPPERATLYLLALLIKRLV